MALPQRPRSKVVKDRIDRDYPSCWRSVTSTRPDLLGPTSPFYPPRPSTRAPITRLSAPGHTSPAKTHRSHREENDAGTSKGLERTRKMRGWQTSTEGLFKTTWPWLCFNVSTRGQGLLGRTVLRPPPSKELALDLLIV
jgi:hypothetical protein